MNSEQNYLAYDMDMALGEILLATSGGINSFLPSAGLVLFTS